MVIKKIKNFLFYTYIYLTFFSCFTLAATTNDPTTTNKIKNFLEKNKNKHKIQNKDPFLPSYLDSKYLMNLKEKNHFKKNILNNCFLDNLKLKGTISIHSKNKNNTTFIGFLVTTNGDIFNVKEGDIICRNKAKINKITKDKITFLLNRNKNDNKISDIKAIEKFTISLKE